MEETKIVIREGTIPEAQAIEREVFGNCQSEEDYNDRKADIMVISYSGHIVSFLVTYIRTGRIYIWLCGTKDIIIDNIPMRKQGFLAKLLQSVLPAYKEEGVFVKTYPNHFRDMYSWILKRGFVNEGDEPENRYPERGPFVRFGTTKKDLLGKL